MTVTQEWTPTQAELGNQTAILIADNKSLRAELGKPRQPGPPEVQIP